MPANIEIEVSSLVARFDELQIKADHDLARLVELLLLENHVLALGQSHGLARGANLDFSKFPRFLALIDPEPEDNNPAQ